MRENKRRILIVDDDSFVRKLVALHLSARPDFDIIEARDGVEAVRRAREDMPDLILMDLSMPGMDGIATIREVRTLPGHSLTPIIFLSAVDDKKRWVEAFGAGASDFVPKPHQKSELLARIETHLKMTQITKELTRQNDLMRRENHLARNIQRQLLPKTMNYPGLETASLYLAQTQIGGDFYETWEYGGRVNFVIGDISGHGSSSALIMAVCKGLFHSQARLGRPPRDLMRDIGRMLYEILEGGDMDMYVTMALASFDRNTGKLGVVSAGHPTVFVVRPDGVKPVPACGPAMGWHESYPWEMVECDFAPGDTLFLYTDGLVEVTDASGTIFGERRLKELLTPGLTPAELVESIFMRNTIFSGGTLDDDMAMLAVRRTA